MGVNVLILEDNPVARGFLRRVVRESFSDAERIDEAVDLGGARRLIASAPADGPSAYKLALVDLELPDGNGMELLVELDRYPAIKIVTTLYSDDEHLFPTLQCGADGYLLKEDRFEVLVEALQKIVRGQPPLSPAIARRMLGHFRGDGRTSDSGFLSTGGFQNSGIGAPDAGPEDERLTPREAEALGFLSKGFTTKEIGSLMGVKLSTVNDHVKTAYRKLRASSRSEVAMLARRQDHG